MSTKVETDLVGHARGAMKVFDDLADVAIGEQRIVGRQAEPVDRESDGGKECAVPADLEFGRLKRPEWVSCKSHHDAGAGARRSTSRGAAPDRRASSR